MDAKELHELIQIISRSDFASFELEREGFKLKLVRADAAGGGAQPVAPRVAVTPAVHQVAPPTQEALPPVTAEIEEGLVEMTSPIVGTFYRSPSPGAPPFVEAGTRVHKGDVLCIVEAMKLMNEIESELDAEVVEIAVTNGQPVEYGEVLFRLRPLG